ncbi:MULTISPECIES: hypothetical protein [Flavobacterium]|uniref:Right handed beta helix region n=1 Tax=Flavobacterium jumunjinense TaxID=998845 RepID=A0ABV5GSK7_9FLAO|nr:MULTISPECIES: hypothetical protein [Flavobacterium]
MRNYSYIFILLCIVLFSCRKDFDFESSTGNLGFSKDTVYLDTVFTNIGSSTYTLKVYNKSNRNISIPKLELEKGNNSKYRLMVDGIPGNVFENVEMLAKDSMYIFIEVTADAIDANPADFLYTDRILFGEGSQTQKVELVTLIQDAYFIYPQRTQNPDDTYTYESINLGVDINGDPIEIRGTVLDETDPINGNELHMTNNKPYVIYGYAVVPSNKTLIVDAGARVHFHAESGLIMANNASMQVNGTLSTTEDLENEVIFEGDRLEPDFSEVSGQWGTIWFTQGSTNINLKNLTIKNATVGLLVSGNDGTASPTITMNNVQIYNSSNVGLLARTGHIDATNVVINNSGQTSLACTFGGNYNFTHCTIANYWGTPNQNSLLIDDYDGNPTYALTQANFNNCLIYGTTNYSISLKKEGIDANFNYQFNNCLIKFNDFSNQFGSHPEYQFSGSKYANCLIATNSSTNKPDFKNGNKNQLMIGNDSAAKGMADFNFSTGTNDILGASRTNPSDIGAYNFIIFN